MFFEKGLHETILKKFEVEIVVTTFKASNSPLEDKIVAKRLTCGIPDEEIIDTRRLHGIYLYDTFFARDNIKLDDTEEDCEEAISRKPYFE